ncbi:hypothetical protein [Rhizobium sp. BE258]|uniref:hypothetical protein n=1 Tax=Rhizobium sp. BE258 TaxID=2817722 RepID=UPI0028656B88|nr:hypothetical protein [Rhizobium sp. BE258]MDR7147056.1 hypothetical protein [Rhizobium sp. BE258]
MAQYVYTVKTTRAPEVREALASHLKGMPVAIAERSLADITTFLIKTRARFSLDVSLVSDIFTRHGGWS